MTETTYKIEGMKITYGDFHSGMVDMHGYPLYETVENVKNELKEKELQELHPDLKEAYEKYQVLLKKYGFWNKITK